MKIKLSNTVSIDLDKLIESRLLVQANSGGGKSWAIRRLIEQSFGKKQIIVIDPEGEFGNMRSRFDFVYAGKGGDAPVESRSAALLAHRLLELKASAVIDLYELPPQERKHYVKLFCEALVNAPKELWHDVLVIIDEAHVFAPEKDNSEALGAVIDLASRGRKRGFAVVLATQRPAKLNKDAAAECNNKLIGRASLDIDRKRAAEELGFTTKEDVLSLRNLEPGEFYVFGPAIGRDVEKTVIGDVAVKPAKRGVARGTIPAPSATVKKILGKLADLPQEAAEEARTVQELQAQVRVAERRIRELERQPEGNPKEIAELKEKIGRLNLISRESANKHNEMVRSFNQIAKLIKPYIEDGIVLFNPEPIAPIHVPLEREYKHTEIKIVATGTNGEMGSGEKVVLGAVAAYEGEGMTREHITVQTGYKRSTRDAYIQRLFNKGFILIRDGRISASLEGVAALGTDYKPLPIGQALVDHYLKTLPAGEARVLEFLINFARGRNDDMSVSRDLISQQTGFKRSTRDAYIQRLMARQLIVPAHNGGVQASHHLV